MSFGFGVGDFITVIQLTKNVRKQFIGAPDQFKNISIELKILNIVLEDVEVNLSGCELNDRQRTDLDEITASCQSILDKLQSTLDKYSELDAGGRNSGKRFKRIWKQFKWDPEVVLELQRNISFNVQLLHTFLGSISTQWIGATKKGVDRLNQHQDDEQRLNIQNWLTPVDYALQHGEAIQRRLAGTGQWLLDSPEYQKWLQASNETLFCQGMPGAGKTILTSTVVDDLLTRFGDDGNIGIAYIYCNFRRIDEQTPEQLIANLLKQLVQGQSSLPASVESLHDEHKKLQKQPSLDELFKTLESVAALYSKVFIVIDAIDECQTANGARSELLAKTRAIQAGGSANIFATSRFVPDSLKSLGGITFLEIRANQADVVKYLEENIHQLTAFHDWTEELRRHVITSISDAVDGMFLLARLYLFSLDDKTTKKKVMAALARFNKKGLKSNESQNDALHEAYESVMARINGQARGFQDLAKKVLSWITLAREPLTVPALRHALAVEANTSCLDEDNFETVERMVSVCAGLVSVQADEIIELVHYTVQEYLERTKDTWFPNAELDIATTCVSYLSFDAFETGPCPEEKDFDERLESNPLFDYAARHWGHHAREVSPQGQQLEVMSNFLHREANTSASAQAMMIESRFEFRFEFRFFSITKIVSGLHLVAYFGLEALVLHLLSRGHDPNVRDLFGETPLSWAARRGHDAVVQTLLAAAGINPNIACEFEDHSRRKRNHWSYADLLLSADDWIHSFGVTPLWYAARNGHESICRLLLAANSLYRKEPQYDTTPLWCAAGNGHKAIVELLLKRGFDPDEADRKGLTPLSIAAYNGHTEVVKLLLENPRVNPNHANWEGATPLSRAAEKGHRAVCELLLEDDRVEPDSRDRIGCTPLIVASEWGHDTVVSLLLAKDGVDVNAIDRLYECTPLQWAYRNGRDGVISLLLADKRVNVNPSTGKPPLWLAAEGGQLTMFEQLLATNHVDLHSRDDEGMTLLHNAARGGNPQIIEILLATGAFNPNVQDYSGNTALMCAMTNPHTMAAKKLLAVDGIKLNVQRDDGMTALSLAAKWGGHKEIIVLLLDKGANIDISDNKGRTPFSHAVAKGHEEIAKLLLDKGANIDIPDNQGRTPFSYTVAKGYEKISRLLQVMAKRQRKIP